MKFTKTTLKNGLRIVTVPMPDNPSVTVLVTVSTGSKYETKDINGLSHFLEHMVFKGTPKRPKASEISRELDSIGAHYNAFTGQEYTGYYAKAATKHLDKILDVVSDMYLNPLFEQSEIDKEKGVIIEEMRMYKDLPQRQVADALGELMYGDQPIGWNVLGTEDNIRSFGRDHFMAYRKDHYVSGATVVTVAGDIDEKEVIEKVEKAFAAISLEPKKDKIAVVEKQAEPAIRAVFKETDQTHMILATRAFKITDPRAPVLTVLSAVLGAGMSSRLFTKLRDEMGICYYVNSHSDLQTDCGDFAVSAGLDNTRVEEGIRAIIAELKQLKTELVPAPELQKVKDFLSGTTPLELETSEARADYAGIQEVIKGQILSPDELVARFNKVTAEHIRDLANELFVDDKLNMAIIGRYKDETPFKPYVTFK